MTTVFIRGPVSIGGLVVGLEKVLKGRKSMARIRLLQFDRDISSLSIADVREWLLLVR